MIVEMRTYSLRPERLHAWLALWKAAALPVQSELLGGFLGMYTTELGAVNEVVHMWRFDSLAERERRRALLNNDERWVSYRRQVEQLAPITAMHSRILRPTPFSPSLNATPPG